MIQAVGYTLTAPSTDIKSTAMKEKLNLGEILKFCDGAPRFITFVM